MDRASKLVRLKVARERLRQEYDERLLHKTAEHVPGAAAATRILGELAPLRQQIHFLDKQILELSSTDELDARLELLGESLDGKMKSEILGDRPLGNAFFEHARIGGELARRRRSGKLGPLTRRLITLVLILAVYAIYRFSGRAW